MELKTDAITIVQRRNEELRQHHIDEMIEKERRREEKLRVLEGMGIAMCLFGAVMCLMEANNPYLWYLPQLIGVLSAAIGIGVAKYADFLEE